MAGTHKAANKIAGSHEVVSSAANMTKAFQVALPLIQSHAVEHPFSRYHFIRGLSNFVGFSDSGRGRIEYGHIDIPIFLRWESSRESQRGQKNEQDLHILE